MSLYCSSGDFLLKASPLQQVIIMRSARGIKRCLLINPKNAFAEKNAGMCEKNLYLFSPANPPVCGRILCKTFVTQRPGYFHDRHLKS